MMDKIKKFFQDVNVWVKENWKWIAIGVAGFIALSVGLTFLI